MSRLGMLNGYLVGIKPRGAAFSLTLRRGRSYIRRGRRMCRALPEFFAPQEHSVSKLPECPSGTKNARLCSRAHPACCVCDPVGIFTAISSLFKPFRHLINNRINNYKSTIIYYCAIFQFSSDFSSLSLSRGKIMKIPLPFVSL